MQSNACKLTSLFFFLSLSFNSAQAEDSTVETENTTEAISIPIQENQRKAKQNEEFGFADTLEAAFAFDPQLKQAYWNYQAEKEEEEIAFAGLLPNVRLNAGHQYEDSDNVYTDDGSGFFDPNQKRSTGKLTDNYWRASLSQPLLDYASYQNFQRGKSVAQTAGYRYQRAEQELIYRVTERYITVLLSAQQVFLTQQKLDALNQKKTQVERALELGVGDKIETLYVKSERDLSNVDLLQAKSDLVDAKTLLSNLTGFDVKFPERWIGSSRTVNPSLLTGTQADWLQSINSNYSVKAAQTKIQQEQHSLAASKAGHYPVLDLNLHYLDRRSDDDFRTRKDAVAALELSIPLYSGGQTNSETRRARARVLASEAELEFTITEKEQQIKLNYDRMVSYKERLIALADSRESGKIYLEAAERQVSLNLSDQVNVLDAQTALVDTLLKITQTLRDYLLADLILRLESGQLDKNYLKEYDNLFNNAVQRPENTPSNIL